MNFYTPYENYPELFLRQSAWKNFQMSAIPKQGESSIQLPTVYSTQLYNNKELINKGKGIARYIINNNNIKDVKKFKGGSSVLLNNLVADKVEANRSLLIAGKLFNHTDTHPHTHGHSHTHGHTHTI